MANHYSGNVLFLRLYREYYGKIYDYCYWRLNESRDFACDCVQNTFFAAFQNIEVLSTHENAGGWLFKTAKNYVQQIKRQIKREKSVVYINDLVHDSENDLVMDIPSSENIVQQIEDKEVHVEIMCANILMSLTENERLLHGMFYLDGLCTAEIAEKLCISESACRIRLYRLRKKIYDKVKKAVDN